MKLGIVLPTFNYNLYREVLIQQTFESLAKTDASKIKPELLLLIRKNSPSSTFYDNFITPLRDFFSTHVIYNCPARGTEPPLVWGTQWLFDNQECTHVTWMGDDALFNPNWLNELTGLIERHPDALSWTVYHSARQEYHTDVERVGDDVMVKSICGHCMTYKRERWQSLGLKWDNPSVWVQIEKGYGTIDLYDAMNFEGERWSSYYTYVNHVGEMGVNCTPGCGETGMNFIP